MASLGAPDLRHGTVSAGHFLAGQDPALVAAEIRALLARPAPDRAATRS
ncbi:hypothetical protein [Nocardia farcinica]|nr:hypothetical protein [Nocardia farcinica]